MRAALLLLVPFSALGCASRPLPCPVTYGPADGWERNDAGTVVQLHHGWKWEPSIYRDGAVITLHALANDKDPAAAIEAAGLPSWTEWKPDPDNKRSATVDQARVERINPRNSTWQDTAPWWPTHLYK